MNVALPPRRELPPDVNERMLSRLVTGMNEAPSSRFERLRGPIAVAAGVTVIAAGALMIPQSTTGSDDPNRVGTPPTSKTRPSRPSPTPIPPTPLPLKSLNQQVSKDLDQCWAVVEQSPRVQEFSAREIWRPVLAVELNGHRIIGFRDNDDGKPGFCDVTATTATVSDPSEQPMRLYATETGKVEVDGHYLSPAGILVGTEGGTSGLKFEVRILIEPNAFLPRTETATVQSKLFAVYVGGLKDGDELVIDPGTSDPRGMRFEQAKVRPIGATGPIN